MTLQNLICVSKCPFFSLLRLQKKKVLNYDSRCTTRKFGELKLETIKYKMCTLGWNYFHSSGQEEEVNWPRLFKSQFTRGKRKRRRKLASHKRKKKLRQGELEVGPDV